MNSEVKVGCFIVVSVLLSAVVFIVGYNIQFCRHWKQTISQWDEFDGIPLMPPFVSCADESSVSNRLVQMGYAPWSSLEREVDESGFNVTSVWAMVEGYKLEESVGKLEVRFLKDKLVEQWFVPYESPSDKESGRAVQEWIDERIMTKEVKLRFY